MHKLLLKFISLPLAFFFQRELNKMSDLNSSIDELDFSQSLGDRQVRRVYLITYSQANLEEFPNCTVFTDKMLEYFITVKGDNNPPVQWACCEEPHKDGGKHYHMTIQFKNPRRWLPIKKYGIALHFSSQHAGYNTAYKYVCKNKLPTEVLQSNGHPNLEVIGSPRTKKCMRKRVSDYKARRTSTPGNSLGSSSSEMPSKIKRLCNTDVAEFIVKHSIRDVTHLLAVAKERYDSGEKDLYRFCVNKQTKALSDICSMAWNIDSAPQVLIQEKLPRLEKVRSFLTANCVDQCNGKWLTCAKQVLRQDSFNISVFADSVREAIIKGRQKNNNIILVGPTNCGKSFLLSPLQLIFKTFMNPASGKYAWIDLGDKEVAFLNDFSWTPEIIQWEKLLNFLEGQTFHLPRPKNIASNKQQTFA